MNQSSGKLPRNLSSAKRHKAISIPVPFRLVHLKEIDHRLVRLGSLQVIAKQAAARSGSPKCLQSLESHYLSGKMTEIQRAIVRRGERVFHAIA
jgi:hypothetical protein